MSYRLRRQLGCGAPCVWLSLRAAVLSILLGAGSLVFAHTKVELIGSDIPQRYPVGSSFIFSGSDSLYLGDSLLVRGTDYIFDNRRGAFDLSRVQPASTDTLRIIFSAVPDWLKSYYGTPPPEIAPSSQVREPFPVAPRPSGRRGGDADVTITGAKTFRFTTSSGGASNFSQSLDMSLSGQLGSGLALTGAISDRGYDPSYGTANSRLNELEKINLKLSSETFTAQVGDIFYSASGCEPGVAKRISGAAVEVRPRNGHFEAVAARPKGRFETARLGGRDNTQGPYQITQGSSAAPIVPGSETVWLDGVKLERGAGKDYTIDYPAGRITFDVNHPIDSRSRIEIDYEPLLTSYRGELFATGGGVSLADSTVDVDIGWYREGDDRDQPLIGDLSDQELRVLETIGDDVSSAVRSGVVEDSLGAYNLVADSLPDTVYQFVGEGNGQYTVVFSYVGPGEGAYAYVGANQYVFAGFGNADYMPVVSIPVPERTDYYRSSVKISDLIVSEFTVELEKSIFDRNLFSSLDDDDNGGLLYRISSIKRWKQSDADNEIAFGARKKEARFRTLQRLYGADFNRTYYLPTGFAPTADETIYEAKGSLAANRVWRVRPFFSRLEYSRQLESRTGGLGLTFEPGKRSRFAASWKTVRTDSDASGFDGSGAADQYALGIEQGTIGTVNFRADYEFDSRTNDYLAERRGTRYHRGRAALVGNFERIEHELFLEDSLTTDWSQQLRRNRLSGSSARKLGDISYSMLVTYQWLDAVKFDQNSLLSRAALDYFSAGRKLDISAVYALSEETRNSRGISYIKVEQGEGDYILQDNEFVPEPGGEYIRVEEILSDVSRVRRGERSFHFGKTWQSAVLKVNSNVEEELLPDGRRQWWWIIPFLSDSRQPYLFYSRQYSADLRLFPIRSGHAVNIDYRESRETRSVANVARQRSDYNGSVKLKQVAGQAFFEQVVDLFRNDRDAYFTSGGNIEGFQVGAEYRQLIGPNELSAGLQFRGAESDRDERSDIVATTVGSRSQFLERGEVRSSLELYRQALSNPTLTPSFLLTGNRPGERGAVWSISVRYSIKGGMRVNFDLSGRHADNRSARITGRGEFVAGF